MIPRETAKCEQAQLKRRKSSFGMRSAVGPTRSQEALSVALGPLDSVNVIKAVFRLLYS